MVVLKGIPTNTREAHQTGGGSGCTAQLMGSGQTAFSLPVSPSMKCFDYRKRLTHGLRSLTILSGMISKVRYERSIASSVSHTHHHGGF